MLEPVAGRVWYRIRDAATRRAERRVPYWPRERVWYRLWDPVWRRTWQRVGYHVSRWRAING